MALPSSVQPPDAEHSRFLGRRWLAPLVFLLLGLSYVFVVPLGEAPDEAAHAYYVGYLLESSELPPLPRHADAFNYQAHHPPLHYLVGALALHLTGVEQIAFPARPNPDLHFDNTGSRAFLPHAWTPAERRPWVMLRLLSLVWGLVTVVSLERLLRACGMFVDDHAAGAAAFWTFALVPQLLFVSATVNNDSAAIALSTAALAALVVFARSLLRGVPQEMGTKSSMKPALAAGSLVALGFFAKATAFFLLAPTALLLLYLLRQRRWTLSVALGLPVALGLVAWFTLCWSRFGTLWPPPPTGYAGGLTEALPQLLDPRWLASAWLSFWAKFGWFNLPLPWPLYLFFLIPSIAVAVGCWKVVRRQPESCIPRWLGTLLLSALTMNVGLLLLFLLRVDFQPQGRFLLPSLGVFAVCAALAFASAVRKPWLRSCVSGCAPTMLALNLVSLSWIGLVSSRIAEV